MCGWWATGYRCHGEDGPGESDRDRIPDHLGLTYLIASESADRFGWRGALFVPSALRGKSRGRHAADSTETPPGGRIHESDTPDRLSSRSSVPGAETLYLTFYNPTLWLLGLSLGLLNPLPLRLPGLGTEAPDGGSADDDWESRSEVLRDRRGSCGRVFLAGIATDRLFGGRGAPGVIAILLTTLGLTTLLYESVSGPRRPGPCFLLVVIGFCIYGPQVLLVGTAPGDLAHRGTGAAAAGVLSTS
ncbi:MAG: hypothetical protein Ct9H300mP1_01800 [Planctomycetaceae bacterium]|nr:MAG: hypothetical protein Ct9H300mP1_01800 [Planctomycetaceae bacterium]